MGLLRSPSQILRKRRAEGNQPAPAAEAGAGAGAEPKAEPEAEPKAAEGEEVVAPVVSNPIPYAPSTTELLLRSDREKSATAYRRAQKAEAEYRAKKDAERSRNDYKSSKSHIKTSCHELKLGLKTAFSSVKTSPAVLKEKQVNAGTRSAVKKQEKEDEKRRKLDAKLKKVKEQQAKLEEANKENNDENTPVAEVVEESALD